VSRFLTIPLIQVATLKFLRKFTKIPVPEVYAYDENPNNPVKAAYMLQERVSRNSQLGLHFIDALLFRL
jgi:hypothetical protein